MWAKLIVIEGCDGLGKTTQAWLLTEMLYRTGGNRAWCVHAPVNDFVFYPVIRHMLKTGAAVRWPNVFQTLQFLNKLTFQLLALPFLMLFNDFVVLDRWSLSAIAYGDAAGANRAYSRVLYRLLKKPDALLVLEGQPHASDKQKDAYETDVDLQSAVNAGYVAWVTNGTGRCQLVEARRGIFDVHVDIVAALRRWGLV